MRRSASMNSTRRQAALAQAAFRRLREAAPYVLAGVRRRHARRARPNIPRNGRSLSADRAAARTALLDIEAAAQRSRGRRRRPQSHAARPVRQQDRPQPAQQRQVRFRPGEVDPLSDHAAAGPRSHPPRFLPAGSADRGRRERRRCPAGGLRVGRRLSRNCKAARVRAGGCNTGNAQAGARDVQDRRFRNSSTASALVHSHYASAFRCSRPARSWRGCGRGFVCSKIYAQSVVDHAGLLLEISTPFGWTMQCPPGINPRTVRNFPIQSTGSRNPARRLHPRRAPRHRDRRADTRCL